MRKGFNFYNSYFTVFKELSDKDKLSFITALLEKQFEGKEPKLTGMANFAYLSQKHSIDAQVVGFETKTGIKIDATGGGSVGGAGGGSVQEEEKGEEKEKKEINDFRLSISMYGGTKRGAATELEDLKKKHKDWKEALQLIGPAIENQIEAREQKKSAGVFVPEWKNLKTWLSQRCWEEVIEVLPARAELPKYELPDMTGGYRG